MVRESVVCFNRGQVLHVLVKKFKPCPRAILSCHALMLYSHAMHSCHTAICNHAVSCAMRSCHRDHAMQSCYAFMPKGSCHAQSPRPICVGSLQEVITRLGKHICQHVLTPLLKLHPHPVHYQTHLQRDMDEGSYTIEVSYSAAGSQQGEEERCSVESAVLQCLQVLKRRLHTQNF